MKREQESKQETNGVHKNVIADRSILAVCSILKHMVERTFLSWRCTPFWRERAREQAEYIKLECTKLYSRTTILFRSCALSSLHDEAHSILKRGAKKAGQTEMECTKMFSRTITSWLCTPFCSTWFASKLLSGLSFLLAVHWLDLGCGLLFSRSPWFASTSLKTQISARVNENTYSVCASLFGGPAFAFIYMH